MYSGSDGHIISLTGEYLGETDKSWCLMPVDKSYTGKPAHVSKTVCSALTTTSGRAPKRGDVVYTTAPSWYAQKLHVLIARSSSARIAGAGLPEERADAARPAGRAAWVPGGC